MQINNFIAKIEQPDIGDVIGRVGGNIPKILEVNIKELVNMRFYTTFQDPKDIEKYISIFVPNDYNTMIENNIYPNCSVQIFLHDKSEESQKEDLTIQTINKSMIYGYKAEKSDTFGFITQTNTPQLIQDESYYTENLLKDNYEFYLQLDEDYYTDSTLRGNYVFGYGALYLYKNKSSGNIIAGFWQFS